MAIEEIQQIPTRLSAKPDNANLENTGYSVRSESKPTSGAKAAPESEYSFWDFLDLINPLQHIPVVNTIYRAATGDTIKPELKLAGGAVLGGVLGFATSLADVIFEQETGKDIGSTMVAAVMGEDKDAPVQVAKVEGSRDLELGTREEAMMQSPAPSPQNLSSISTIQSQMRALDTADAQILALYGASPSPLQASKAYEQADMRGYLQQASLNQLF